MTEFHTHLSELSERFDAYIIDLWGVLHDGTNPYPGAKECLTKLKASGKEIVLLSNAPRRAHLAGTRLTELGFNAGLYDHILTSGELTNRHITKQIQYGELGTKFYYIGPEKDRNLLHSSGAEEVSDATEADFAVVAGFDEFGDVFDTKEPYVRAALDANLPLYCANPDRLVVRQTGETMLCAGLLAEWYLEHGGEVVWFGKPYSRAYEACLNLFETKDKSRIAGIGDSFHTDIGGANAAGISSILCAGGIHKNDFGVQAGELPTEAQLAPLVEQHGECPDIILPQFVW